MCVDNLANRDVIPQNVEALNLIISYDVILLPSQDLVDSYTKYLYENILQDVNVQAPVIALASMHPDKKAFVSTVEFMIIDGFMASNFKKFTRNNIEKLRGCPTKPTQFPQRIPLSSGTPKQAIDYDYDSLRKVAVIIEPRITPTLEYILR